MSVATEPLPEVETPAVAATDFRSIHRLGWFRKALLFAAPLMLIGLAWGIGSWIYFKGYASSPDPVAEAGLSPDGARLFAVNCAHCHGIQGNGRGDALLNPPARYFGFDRFRFVTTQNNSRGMAISSDADLARIIHRGIPGSAMPAFPHLRENEIEAIIAHLRNLTRNGVYSRLYQRALKEAEDEGIEVNRGELRRKVDALVEIGPSIKIPSAFQPSSPESIARGKVVFDRVGCSKCHGKEGKGDGEQVKDPNFKNEDGTRARPRDLTLGLYKAGGEKEHLFARVVLGIPGTPMPANANALKPDEIEDLLNYVQSLPGSIKK